MNCKEQLENGDTIIVETCHSPYCDGIRCHCHTKWRLVLKPTHNWNWLTRIHELTPYKTLLAVAIDNPTVCIEQIYMGFKQGKLQTINMQEVAIITIVD